MSMDWMGNFIRSIFIGIDRIVYSAIEQVYELFILISEAGIFSQDTIQAFAGRIYVFLGLIMIFVVSIAMVQYILDPKKFNDSKIGGAKLIKDFVFVLIAIILIPYGFEMAFKLQRIVLKDNLIGSLILGIKFTDAEAEEGKDASYYATYGGKVMAYATASAFVTFNREVASFTCINQPVTSDGKFNEACGDIAKIPFEGRADEEGTAMENVGQYTEFVNRTKDFRNILDKDYVTLKFKSNESGDLDLIDYSFILSTIAGGFIIYVLLGFCIDIAVRSVKLGFLQLIAPVPLMMKIIPGSGQKKFDAWVKQCVTTYMDIFTRLAAIYFAIFIISAITTDGIQNVGGTNFVDTTLVRVAIIFGALMFASELPKLIGDIIGGSGGNFKFGGPMKKIMSNPYSGAVAGAIGGGILATGANAYMQSKNWKTNWDKVKNNDDLSTFQKGMAHTRDMFSFAGGGVSGFKRGGQAGASGKTSLYKASTDAAAASSLARNRRQAGYGIKETIGEQFSRAVGQTNSVGKYGTQTAELEMLKDEYESAYNIQRRTEENYADSTTKLLQETGMDLNDFNAMNERKIDGQTGLHGELTPEAIKARNDYINNNNLNFQQYEDDLNNANENLRKNYEAYENYKNNVLAGKEQDSAERRKEFEDNGLKLTKQVETAQKTYDDKYEITKQARKKFDNNMQLEKIKVDAKNAARTKEKIYKKAQAANDKFGSGKGSKK